MPRNKGGPGFRDCAPLPSSWVCSVFMSPSLLCGWAWPVNGMWVGVSAPLHSLAHQTLPAVIAHSSSVWKATSRLTTWEDPESLHDLVEGPGPRFGDFSVPASSRAWRTSYALLSVLRCWESCLLKRDKSLFGHHKWPLGVNLFEQMIVIDRQFSVHLLLSVTQMLSFSLSPLHPPPPENLINTEVGYIQSQGIHEHQHLLMVRSFSSSPCPSQLFHIGVSPPGTLGSLAVSCYAPLLH